MCVSSSSVKRVCEMKGDFSFLSPSLSLSHVVRSFVVCVVCACV